jgi:hypothetical protein
MNEKEKDHFREWLQKNTDLSTKVIGDTVSRLSRVENITPLTTDGAAEDFLFKLGKKPAFTNLGQSVKSQLKRSYNLYHKSKNMA